MHEPRWWRWANFHDKLAIIGGSSSKINAAKQLKLTPLKTEPHTTTLKSCEPILFRKICNGSYTSGDFRNKGILTAGEDGNSSMICSARRSTWFSIRDSLTSDSESGSSTTSRLGSSSDSSTISGSNSGSTSSCSLTSSLGTLLMCRLSSCNYILFNMELQSRASLRMRSSFSSMRSRFSSMSAMGLSYEPTASNKIRIILQTGPEKLLDCCRNYTGTKQELLEI